MRNQTKFICTIMSILYHDEENMTAWKLSRYGDFSGPYFSIFSPNRNLDRNFVDLKKLCSWTLFTQCIVWSREFYHLFFREISVCRITKITKFQATSFWNEYSIPIQLIISFHHFSAKKNNQRKNFIIKYNCCSY